MTWLLLLKFLKDGNKLKLKTATFNRLLSSYFDLAVTIVSPLLVMPSLINSWSHEEFGIYILLSSLVAYLNVTNFGLTTSLVTFCAVNKGNTKQVQIATNTVFVFFLMISLVSAIIISLISCNWPYLFSVEEVALDVRVAIFLFSFVFLFDFTSSAFYSNLFATGEMVLANCLKGLRALVVAIGIFYIVNEGADLIDVVEYNLYVSVLFFFVFVIVYFFRYRDRVTFSISFKRLKGFLSKGFYYFLGSLSVLLVFHTDSLVISSMISVGAVGAYAVIFKMVDASQRIVFKVCDILLPSIAQDFENNKLDALSKEFLKVLCITIILISLVSIILLTLFPTIIDLWIGDSFEYSENVVFILLAFTFFHCIVRVPGVFIAAIGKHKVPSQVSLLEAVTNLVMSIFLAREYGVEGVAMATLLSTILFGWFNFYWLNKYIRFFYY